MGQIENKRKMTGLSSPISVTTLNVNRLNNNYITWKWFKR